MDHEEFIKLSPKKRVQWLGAEVKSALATSSITEITFKIQAGNYIHNCRLQLSDLKIRAKIPGRKTSYGRNTPAGINVGYSGDYVQLGTVILLELLNLLKGHKHPWLVGIYDYYVGGIALQPNSFGPENKQLIPDYEW